MLRLVVIAVAIALTCLMFAAWFFDARKDQLPVAPGVIPRSSIFHKPSSAPCPESTTLMPGIFFEADGSKQDGCFNPRGDRSIDYLNPGEAVAVDRISVWYDVLRELEAV